MAKLADTNDDAFAILGLAPGATVETILESRRTLAKIRHPDAGGSVEAMQELNNAVEEALIEARSAQASSPGFDQAAQRRRPPSPPPKNGVRQDHPSFTVEALPAEVFEAMLLAAAELGEVSDDDPPYLLEVVMATPTPAWCRLEIAPDAGAATVSITTARVTGHATPDVYEVRDAWIEALNRLDWSDRGPSPQP